MSSGFNARYTLECPECQREFDPLTPQTYCAQCNSPLLTYFNLAALRGALQREEFSKRGRGLWRWHELLPVNDPHFQLTLGEGDTPLLSANRLGSVLGLPQLFIKDESLNPTGTFKARGMAVALAKALELGLREFVIPTAGNAGAALAFYADRAGCQAHIFMPTDTPSLIQYEVRMAGADLQLVDGLISDAARLAAAEAARSGWFDLSTFKEPFRVEGKKIMGYEIAEAFAWELPDVILYPTGGGTGLVGMWKAFAEMETLGWIGTKRPRMISVQAAGCAPVVRAFHEGAERIQPWEGASTLAAGLRVPSLFADRLVLRCLRESHGNAVSVSEEAILSAQKELARLEGILAAPEGAATLAGLKKLMKSGEINEQEKIVLFNTGTGLKYYQGNYGS